MQIILLYILKIASLTSLGTILYFYLKKTVSEASLNTDKRIILRSPFLHRVCV